jgi:hypothetical protein
LFFEISVAGSNGISRLHAIRRRKVDDVAKQVEREVCLLHAREAWERKLGNLERPEEITAPLPPPASQRA